MKFGRIHKLLYVAILAALALATVVPAFAKTDARPNIVEIAASNPDFSTLVAAVQKAGLVDASSRRPTPRLMLWRRNWALPTAWPWSTPCRPRT
jgi:hypothetical protein